MGRIIVEAASHPLREVRPVTSHDRFTLIDDGREVQTVARAADGEVWLDLPALETGLGLTLTDEGLCADGRCLLMPAATTGPDGLRLAAVAEALGRPLAVDAAEGAAWLGVAASDRAQPLRDLTAPDFTLPELAGRSHSLSEHRGKKRMLVAWGSW
jgi:hypothetical protein